MSIATINKKFFQDKLLEHEQLSSEQAFYLVRDFFDIIGDSLEQGKEVKLVGLGHFRLLDKVARPGRDILKNTMVQISARRVVAFTPSKKLVDDINANCEQLLAKLPVKPSKSK